MKVSGIAIAAYDNHTVQVDTNATTTLVKLGLFADDTLIRAISLDASSAEMLGTALIRAAKDVAKKGR